MYTMIQDATLDRSLTYTPFEPKKVAAKIFSRDARLLATVGRSEKPASIRIFQIVEDIPSAETLANSSGLGPKRLRRIEPRETYKNLSIQGISS